MVGPDACTWQYCSVRQPKKRKRKKRKLAPEWNYKSQKHCKSRSARWLFHSAENKRLTNYCTSREEDSRPGNRCCTHIAWVRCCCPRSVMNVMCHASNPTRVNLTLNTSDSAIIRFLSLSWTWCPSCLSSLSGINLKMEHLTSVSCCRCLIIWIHFPAGEWVSNNRRPLQYPFAVPSAPVPKSIY